MKIIKLSKTLDGSPPPPPPHTKKTLGQVSTFLQEPKTLKKCDVVGYKNVFGTRSWWIFDKR
jgi:hypothetical protein